MAKKTAIHQEEELAAQLPAALDGRTVPGVAWDLSGNTLRLRLDGRDLCFQPHYRLHPARQELQTLRLAADVAGKKNPVEPLLVTARLGRATWEGCRELGLSCLDLNGTFFLRAPGLWVENGPGAGTVTRFRAGRPEVNVFAPRSVRIVRCLLAERDRAWRPGELVTETGVTAGLVSQVLHQLARWGWVEGSRTAPWTVTRPDALLDAWALADRWERRVTVRQYTTAERDLDKLAALLTSKLLGFLAFTQWFAASRRFPYTEPPVISAYLKPVFKVVWPEATLKSIGLQPVPQGGRVWLLQPRDEGVLQNSRLVNGLPLVSDPQIYLDLLKVGLRGPEQAEALRGWEGFCRP